MNRDTLTREPNARRRENLHVRRGNNDHSRAELFGAGAIAGLLATVPMTLVMLATHKQLPPEQRYPLPPSLITQRAAAGFAVPYPSPMPNLISTLAAHFAFGALAGAMYAGVPAALRRQCPVTTGVGYGLAVWAASYLGWVPALRLMPPATRQPAARNAMMIVAHVVWGAALSAVLEALRSRIRTPSDAAAQEAGGGKP